jgi:hypothetical protein
VHQLIGVVVEDLIQGVAEVRAGRLVAGLENLRRQVSQFQSLPVPCKSLGNGRQEGFCVLGTLSLSFLLEFALKVTPHIQNLRFQDGQLSLATGHDVSATAQVSVFVSEACFRAVQLSDP